MNKCRFKSIRHHKGRMYYYCKSKREIILYNDCIGCPDCEVKKRKQINKVSKHKKVVSPETHANVYMRCNGKCAICGTTQDLNYHHIEFRSERPDLINEPSNGIMLCGDFANNCHRGKAHKNKKYWKPILKKMAEEKE